MSDINAITQAFKPLQANTVPGLTDLGLSVIASAHAGQALPQPPGGTGATPDSSSKQFALTNTSTTLSVAFGFGQTAAQAVAAAVLPADAVVGGILVGPLQTRVVSIDGNPLFVSAIATGAGPTLVSVSPGNGR